MCNLWSNFGHFVVFLLSIFDRYHWFSKILVYFWHFRHLVVSVRLLHKSKAKKRQLSFGQLLTVKNFWLLTINFREIPKFFDKRMAIVKSLLRLQSDNKIFTMLFKWRPTSHFDYKSILTSQFVITVKLGYNEFYGTVNMRSL